MSQVMLPGDANLSGNVHGGVIMKLVDTTAGACAIRHVRRRVVTARIDSMSFLQPVFLGNLVTIRASVNDVGTTSLEVGVRVDAEDLFTGEIRHVSSAYLVFVALDDDGRPTPVPGLIADTPEEKRRQTEAKLRRGHRRRGEEAINALRASMSPRATMSAWRRPGVVYTLIGHRGAGGLAPENTLPSFDLGMALGVDAVECDVHLSRDGIPVVIHDHTVDRTTNGHGLVAAMSVEELQALDGRGPEWQSVPATRIPTLDELLTWANSRARLVIELKGTENPNLVPATIDRIRAHGQTESVFLISFDHVALRHAHDLAPEISSGALYYARPADPVGIATAAGADALCPQWSLVTNADVSAAHEAGLAVCVWTVNESHEIRSSLAAGVDALTTDFPDRVRSTALSDR